MQKRFFLFIFLAISMAAHSQSGVYTKDGLAIGGYDPVSYFTDAKPVKGSKDLTMTWNGAPWSFSSQANLDLFKADPAKYAPQYGGYCAYGASELHLAPTDPQAWTIVGDKLYLNYSMKVKQLWLKDTSARIAKANDYWKTIKQ